MLAGRSGTADRSRTPHADRAQLLPQRAAATTTQQRQGRPRPQSSPSSSSSSGPSASSSSSPGSPATTWPTWPTRVASPAHTTPASEPETDTTRATEVAFTRVEVALGLVVVAGLTAHRIAVRREPARPAGRRAARRTRLRRTRRVPLPVEPVTAAASRRRRKPRARPRARPAPAVAVAVARARSARPTRGTAAVAARVTVRHDSLLCRAKHRIVAHQHQARPPTDPRGPAKLRRG